MKIWENIHIKMLYLNNWLFYETHFSKINDTFRTIRKSTRTLLIRKTYLSRLAVTVAIMTLKSFLNL